MHLIHRVLLEPPVAMRLYKGYPDTSLKCLLWCITKKATMTGDGSLKRLHWRELKKATMSCHWKRLFWRELKRLRWRGTYHWKCYPDVNWKGYNDTVDYFTELEMKLQPGHGGYKSTSQGRELRRIQTHRPHTLGSKEPESCSPRWVRQKLREKNNGLPPNDPNHDEKHPTDAKRLLCKCDLDCQSHMSLDHDMYDRRYWSCP
jgi:hypothetical protein